MSALDIVLWGVLPYLVALTLIAGLVWRYRYDQFGWTTRSSQLYESRLLRVASPMFHFGLLVVLGGHLVGLLIPKDWTDRVVTQEMYHWVAVGAGTLAGIATLIGIALLIYRRRTTGPGFLTSASKATLAFSAWSIWQTDWVLASGPSPSISSKASSGPVAMIRKS